MAPAAGLQLVHENEMDQALLRAASNALGQREGTIVVMDPQSGRVRAIVNREIAFENSFAPGSTIKPFIALAALRSGLIDKNSRTLCRQHYSRKDFDTVCAHPRDLPPFNPSQAIAYSCNYYFGTLGDRLNEELLSDTLSSFGFGKQTLLAGNSDSSGNLRRGKRDPRNALGEGDYLQATPIQLITAYSALVNGGYLPTPRVASVSDSVMAPRGPLEIAAEHRSIIIAGMRGAVRYGTAASARLDSPSLYIFGKTGTSTPAKGFRTQGWFVGFASDATNEGVPAPANIHLAVLVFLKRAHGADAAATSRPIFEEYERVQDAGTVRGGDSETGGANAETQRQGNPGTLTMNQGMTSTASRRLPVSPSPGPFTPSASIRVHQVSENVTQEMSLEGYVLGVLAAEGSSEDQPEALKALAIAARTYAVKNAGRHTREGFDFCTTTHCQRFLLPVNQAAIRPAIRNAVKQTEGEVLLDQMGQAVDSYFSASCGGMTANIQTLWGGKAPAYLRGVRDESCSTMPHHSWTDVISAPSLLSALRSDARTDPGAVLHDLIVIRRDATRRAELIMINGERHHTVSGWNFKIIVGRKLGWNLLKSSRFEVVRSGSDFVFRGSGFGHGLGLCQEGAHVMAQRGANYKQILGKYFPGTSVGSALESRGVGAVGLRDRVYRFAALPPHSAERLRLSGRGLFDFEATPPPRGVASLRNGSDRPERRGLSALGGGIAAKTVEQSRTFADLLWNTEALQPSKTILAAPRPSHPIKRLTLSSEHFRVSYPTDTPQRDAQGVLRTLEAIRVDLSNRISSAGLSFEGFPSLEIFINDTTGDFVGRTGQPWWSAAAAKGNQIELQPIAVLTRRGVLAMTLRHELVHTLIEAFSHGRAPRWLAEGMALYFAGEGPMVSRYTPRGKMTVEEIDQKLAQASSADQMRRAYAAAYREVSSMALIDGEKSLWQKIAGTK